MDAHGPQFRESRDDIFIDGGCGNSLDFKTFDGGAIGFDLQRVCGLDQVEEMPVGAAARLARRVRTGALAGVEEAGRDLVERGRRELGKATHGFK